MLVVVLCVYSSRIFPGGFPYSHVVIIVLLVSCIHVVLLLHHYMGVVSQQKFV